MFKKTFLSMLLFICILFFRSILVYGECDIKLFPPTCDTDPYAPSEEETRNLIDASMIGITLPTEGRIGQCSSCGYFS